MFKIGVYQIGNISPMFQKWNTIRTKVNIHSNIRVVFQIWNITGVLDLEHWCGIPNRENLVWCSTSGTSVWCSGSGTLVWCSKPGTLEWCSRSGTLVWCSREHWYGVPVLELRCDIPALEHLFPISDLEHQTNVPDRCGVPDLEHSNVPDLEHWYGMYQM